MDGSDMKTPGEAMVNVALTQRVKKFLAGVIGVGTVLAMLIGAQPAVADESRSISGTVTLPEGAPSPWLGGVYVTAQGINDSSYFSVPVDETGAYELSGLPAGSYRVGFGVLESWDEASASQPPPNLIHQYYPGTPTFTEAIPVDITLADKHDINASLAFGKSIAGVVTLADDAPTAWLEGVLVRATSTTAVGATPQLARLDSSGRYSINKLAPDTYRVQFEVTPIWNVDDGTSTTPNLIGQYYPGTLDYFEAQAVDVTVIDQSGIDANLDRGRTISGTISLPAGTPQDWLESVWMTATSGLHGGHASIDPVSGEYAITGLVPAAYTVKASVDLTRPEVNLVDTYYPAAWTAAGAEPVDLTASDAHDIDIAMTVGRSIAGTVSIPDDAPREWMRAVGVSAFTEDGTRLNNWADVDPEHGTYTLARLPATNLYLHFDASFYTEMSGDRWEFFYTDLAAEYYDDATSVHSATPVSTVDGDHIGIDAELGYGASFEYSVDLRALPEAAGFGIALTDETGTQMLGGWGDPFPADARVESTHANLAPGTYRVALTLFDEAFEGQSTQFLRFGTESSITLEAGDKLTGLELVARPVGASLSGTLNALGFPDDRTDDIRGSVLVYERLDDQWVRLPWTQFDGTANGETPYQMNLAAGTYTVGFENEFATVDVDDEIFEQWWRGQTSLDAATPIVLTAESSVPGIDGFVSLGSPPPLPEPDPVNTTPIYRFWSDRYQGHFYTASEGERDAIRARWPHIWNYEGPRYEAYDSQVEGTVPLYRFWSSRYNGHFYTADQGERDAVIDRWPDVWDYEGVAYYVYPADSDVANTATVARFWSNSARHHFYTADAGERDEVIRRWSTTWSYEGDNFRVPVTPLGE